MAASELEFELAIVAELVSMATLELEVAKLPVAKQVPVAKSVPGGQVLKVAKLIPVAEQVLSG